MNGEGKPRPPPQVIRVPPPDAPLNPPYLALLIAVPILIPLLIVLATTQAAFLLAVAAVFAGTGGILLGLVPWSNRQYRRRRLEYLKQLGPGAADPRVAAIHVEWRSPYRRPDAKTIRAALNKVSGPTPPGARVVCLGMLDVPEVAHLFFEPEIITAGRRLGRRMFFIPVAAGVIGLWLLQKLGILPFELVKLDVFWYVLGTGFAVSALWVWRSIIRPTYVRMAPGIIQVLEYPYGKGTPAIRSYPLDAATLAVVRGAVSGRKRTVQTLTLLRDGREDSIYFARMYKPEQIIERAWQALLSTAPTPPLSDEDLLG